MTCLNKKVPANSVPAAAVRQEGLMLFGIIWCKGFIGGFLRYICMFFSKELYYNTKKLELI